MSGTVLKAIGGQSKQDQMPQAPSYSIPLGGRLGGWKDTWYWCITLCLAAAIAATSKESQTALINLAYISLRWQLTSISLSMISRIRKMKPCGTSPDRLGGPLTQSVNLDQDKSLPELTSAGIIARMAVRGPTSDTSSVKYGAPFREAKRSVWTAFETSLVKSGYSLTIWACQSPPSDFTSMSTSIACWIVLGLNATASRTFKVIFFQALLCFRGGNCGSLTVRPKGWGKFTFKGVMWKKQWIRLYVKKLLFLVERNYNCYSRFLQWKIEQ